MCIKLRKIFFKFIFKIFKTFGCHRNSTSFSTFLLKILKERKKEKRSTERIRSRIYVPVSMY